MKKSILAVTALVFMVAFVKAQNLETVKNSFLLQQYKQAKTDIDKAMANPKIASKQEAHLLKAGIYSAMSLDEEFKNKPEGMQMLADAMTAYNKYKELDKEMKLAENDNYQNATLNMYSAYYSAGYFDYTKKNWKDGFEKLKTAVDFSDYLISKKVLQAALDTNVLILAGITAEQGGNKEQASIYYSRLADAKIGGADFESIYQFLVNYYFTHKDLAKFEKYKQIGQELFPNSVYFKYDKIDFAVGLETEFTARIKAVEEVLATDPDNLKANQLLGELIYDTLDSHIEGAVQPANAEELEKRMVTAFNKAYSLKPDTIISQLFLADHYYNKTQLVNDKRSAHAKVIGSKPKPTADELKKREDLDKELGLVYDELKVPSERVADFYSKHGNLTAREKQDYKKVVGYLSDVYGYKKIRAKGNAAEQAKFAGEEKKWNDRYESIK